jgi:hypothetical protein
MNNQALKIINPFLFLAALTQIVTGLAMALTRNHLAYEIHEKTGLLFIVLLVLHLVFNWGWIKASLFGK